MRSEIEVVVQLRFVHSYPATGGGTACDTVIKQFLPIPLSLQAPARERDVLSWTHSARLFCAPF